jgi:hypothetical protein
MSDNGELPVYIPLDMLEKVMSHINLLDLNKLATTSKYVLNVIKSQINTFKLNRPDEHGDAEPEIITSFQMNGQYLFICRYQEVCPLEIQIIDIKTGIECFDDPSSPMIPTYSINLTNDHIISSNHIDKVRLWEYNRNNINKFNLVFLFTNPLLHVYPRSEITAQNIAKDGSLIAIAIMMTDYRHHFVYVIDNKQKTQNILFLQNFDIVKSVHFVTLDVTKSSTMYLVCAGLDYINLYDYNGETNPKITEFQQFANQDNYVLNVTKKIYTINKTIDEKMIRAISVNDKYIAYCLFDYSVCIYEFKTEKIIKEFQIEKYNYSRHHFQHPFIITDNDMLIIGGYSITIRQGPNFDVVIHEIKIKSECLAYNKDTSIIATMCNGDKLVRFINLANISRMEKMHGTGSK